MNSKRITAGLLAGVMLASSALVSCSQSESEPPKSKRTNVYSGVEVPLPSDISYVSSVDYTNNNVYTVYTTTYTLTMNELGEEVERRTGYYWEGSQEDSDEETTTTLPDGWYYDYLSLQNVTTVNVETGESTTVSMPSDIPGYLQSMAIDNKGIIDMVYCQYNWDETTGNSQNTYTLVQIDSTTGEQTGSYDLADCFTAANVDISSTYINSIKVSDSGDVYVVAENVYIVFDSDMNYKTKFELDGGWISNICISGDSVYLYYYEDSNQKLCVVANGTKTDYSGENIKTVINNMYEFLGFYNGQLYYRTSTNVSKYDPKTDTISEEMNFINSDISQSQINSIKLLPDGRMLVTTYNYSNESSQTTIQLMTKVPDEEIQEEIIVKLATLYSNYNIVNSVINFNKQNTGIRISLVTYDQYNNEENNYQGGITQFNNDIITGNLPDIILLDSSLPVESYFQKGIFADLNTYIDDAENGIDRSNYLTNIFDATTVDGKLYSIIMSFSLQTLIAKSQYVGTESGWTLEEMLDTINNMPEGMTAFFTSSRDEIIQQFFGNCMDLFINWETGETKFETQGFIDFIKYLAQCPEQGYWEAYYASQGDDYVYDQEVETEMQQKYELRYYKDYGLIEYGSLSSFTDFLYDQNTFASSDITAIGYPTDSGNGVIIVPNIELAISQSSKVKNQAWEVLKFFLNDESITNRNYFFSPNISNLESQAANAKDNYYYYENTEDDYEWYRERGYSEDYIEYLKKSNQPFDQKVVDFTMDLIKNATVVSRSDSDLLEIITEELSGFFGGTKTAEETAKVIASRAKIYISEHS
jgi:ABC-type glycerol-3-phosphate transport system substrate-binding protein